MLLVFSAVFEYVMKDLQFSRNELSVFSEYTITGNRFKDNTSYHPSQPEQLLTSTQKEF